MDRLNLAASSRTEITKSKKHLLAITWDYDGQKGGISFEADSREHRGILVGLEAMTQMKAVDSRLWILKSRMETITPGAVTTGTISPDYGAGSTITAHTRVIHREITDTRVIVAEQITSMLQTASRLLS